VEKVDFPEIRRVPLAVMLPWESAVNLVFSTQFEPSHVSVELVALPINTAPKIVFQKVDVPLLRST
jgi:hypothetical protein